ncbi:MAG TPA: sulfotransferase [Caulobacteraceae bacterium]|nr:sulfotransferase [Caulobacteraceae bacterium]
MRSPSLADRAEVDAGIQLASSLLATDVKAAQREAEAVLRRAPQDPRARLILASARRRQHDIAGALALLRPLAGAFPQAPQTQFELGLCLAEAGHPAEAAVALRRAVELKPDHVEAWRALGDLLFGEGDAAGAEHAFAAHDRAAVRDPALRPAAQALFEGRLRDAEALLRQRLALRPADAEALKLYAHALLRLEDYPAAEPLLRSIVAADPGDHGARFSLASALFNQQKAAQAMAEAQRLLALDPAAPPYRNLAAACASLVGDFVRAIRLNQGLVAQFPRHPRVWLNHGHSLRTVGRTSEAVEAYRQAIALAPQLGDAWWALANLKLARFDEADIAAMRAQLARGDIGDEDRLHLDYALGKALEDRRAFEESFGFYAEGARVRRRMRPYDGHIEAALAKRSAEVLSHGFFETLGLGGCLAADPIFIVGLPRSGSTLIEQILASHSQVEGVMELGDIGQLADELLVARGAGRDDYPALIATLTASERQQLGQAYLDRTRVHRRTTRPFFVDKMPNNFRHLGLIRAILPNAKVIDARRHPMGAGFSAFKQHFNQGQSFSYDLRDIGAFYGGYLLMMRQIDLALPGWVCRTVYEDVVEDADGQVRRLLDFCSLPFEEPCLRYWETERPVKTVSSEQVRRPIFRDGLEQWRNYEPWLGPLRDALGPALETWRD